jgi:hypothetical protein
MKPTYYCNRCGIYSPIENMVDTLSRCAKCDDEINLEKIEVDEVVLFQVYEDEEPIECKVKRIGTLDELNRFKLNPDDDRLFYEVVGTKRASFKSLTTERWLFKIKQDEEV